MKRFFQKLLKIGAYAAAALLILLAVGVGLIRLFLPRLPEYQEAIKERASDAIGMEVEFVSMNPRWALGGPELEFYGAELISRDNQKPVIAAERVSVVVSIDSLIFEQKFVVDFVLRWLYYGKTNHSLFMIIDIVRCFQVGKLPVLARGG